MRIIAELTIPNNNSWDRKFSGKDNTYTKIFSKNDSKKSREYIGNYYYNFGDGWGANVNIREAKPRERVTNKFCGYDWMIDSIRKHKKIKI